MLCAAFVASIILTHTVEMEGGKAAAEGRRGKSVVVLQQAPQHSNR